jgi:type I restriction enzyme S subunit
MELKAGYKQTEVGVIPIDWEVKHLGNLGKFSKGSGVRKNQALSGDIPCIRYGEIYTRHNDYIKQFYSFISKDISETAKKLKFGDILFAGSGETKEEIGKSLAFIDNFEAYAGGDIVILSTVNSDPLYLGYLLNAPIIQKQKASRGQGDAVVHISSSQLENIVIPLPSSIKEQTAIATALSDADAWITSLEQLIAKKRLLKQGAMQELLKPKEGWEVKKIKEIVSTPVTDGPHETPQFHKTGVPFLSVNNLVDNKIDLTDLRFISKDDDNRFSLKCKPQKDDILLGKAASVGKVALVEIDIDFNVWSPLALIRLKKEYSPKYIYYCFQTNEIAKQIGFFTNSSSQGNIGMGDIEKITFAIPKSFEEQTSIATILSDMDAELTALETKLEKAKKIKLGMMQELLTGKIRLI